MAIFIIVWVQNSVADCHVVSLLAMTCGVLLTMTCWVLLAMTGGLLIGVADCHVALLLAMTWVAPGNVVGRELCHDARKSGQKFASWLRVHIIS